MARGNFGRYNAKDIYKFFKTSTRILLERCVLVRVSRGKKLSSLFSVVERFLCTEKKCDLNMLHPDDNNQQAKGQAERTDQNL